MKTCEYLQLGTQTTWTMDSLFLKAEKEMRVEMQRSIVTFSPTLLLFIFLFVSLLYVPSQQLWSLRDGQFT